MAFQLAHGGLIGDKWEVITVHNVGLFGGSFNVRSQETGEIVFCKVETFDAPVLLLRYCALVTQELTHHLQVMSVPRFIEYGMSIAGQIYYMCTDLIGPTIEAFRQLLPPEANDRFSLLTCLHIGRESLLNLKELHDAGYLHRDVKPETFALNPRSEIGGLSLLMLGMIRRWRNFGDTGALPERTVAPFRGNLEYASINTLRSQEQSRFDDLWSWFYMLVDLTTGSLPWIPVPDGINIFEIIKQTAFGREVAHRMVTGWLQTAPDEYVEIFHVLDSSDENEEPDYNRLLQVIRKAACRSAKELNGNVVLDWEPGGRYFNQMGHLLA